MTPSRLRSVLLRCRPRLRPTSPGERARASDHVPQGNALLPRPAFPRGTRFCPGLPSPGEHIATNFPRGTHAVHLPLGKGFRSAKHVLPRAFHAGFPAIPRIFPRGTCTMCATHLPQGNAPFFGDCAADVSGRVSPNGCASPVYGRALELP